MKRQCRAPKMRTLGKIIYLLYFDPLWKLQQINKNKIVGHHFSNDCLYLHVDDNP